MLSWNLLQCCCIDMQFHREIRYRSAVLWWFSFRSVPCQVIIWYSFTISTGRGGEGEQPFNLKKKNHIFTLLFNNDTNSKMLRLHRGMEKPHGEKTLTKASFSGKIAWGLGHCILLAMFFSSAFHPHASLWMLIDFTRGCLKGLQRNGALSTSRNLKAIYNCE